MNNNNILIGYKKARSLLDKIITMVEQGEYCIDIMQQNLAVMGLLKSAHNSLMENHLNSCFKNAMSTNNEKRKQQMINEILKVSRLTNK
ncbi:MAG TPA: metal-sensing transcriptional repressor [Candidatus Gracilibacteria bacterium]|nr:metal-sensing transcriptional repressor [Candidatus Gracilibacteria bacterium]